MAEATLSSKNQIVIPREAREALGLKPGDKLLVTTTAHGVYLYPKPKSFRKAIRGLGKGLYGPDYLNKERDDW